MDQYEYALATTPDPGDTRTPLEQATDGWSVAYAHGRYYLTDPAGRFVTSDLHAVCEFLKECHPHARRIIARDAAVNLARRAETTARMNRLNNRSN